MQKIKIRNILAIVFAFVVFIISLFFGGGAGVSYAATVSTDVQSAFDSRNVLDDLDGSTIGGNTFNLEDYPFNERGKPQVISLIEFGYSFYIANQSDYGLYVYIYNPQGYAFDMAGNSVMLDYGDSDNWANYPLEFLNYSMQAGYEGLFYKFKVTLNATQKAAVLNGVTQSARVYEISGITLTVKSIATEYTVAQVYTYSGYAEGYGSELSQTDTLSCTVDGFQTYLELDVNHTTYRQEGDYYNGEQSQLDSCFFRVPNKYFEDYGELTKIACEWYEYFTKPILVIEDSYTYNKIDALRGGNTATLSDDVYFLFNIQWENVTEIWFQKKGVSDWTSNYGYEVGDSYSWGFLWLNGASFEYDSFENFAAAFYTSDSDNCTVSGEELRAKLLRNSETLGSPYIYGGYSEALFEDYVQDGRTRGYNYKEITSDSTTSVFWNRTTKDFWQEWFTGGYDVDTIYDSLPAIVKISDEDLTGTDEEIAARLYISSSDVSTLKTEQAKAKSNDETVVLLRYSSTTYFAAPVVSSYCSASNIDDGKTLVKNNVTAFGNGDYTGYASQETVYLGFDIISLTYTNDDVETVIPVVASPQDVISGLTPSLNLDYHTDGEGCDGFAWWKILAVLALILILVLCAPILPYIVQAVLWVILLPFKLIWALFKGIKNSVSKNKRGKQDDKGK